MLGVVVVYPDLIGLLAELDLCMKKYVGFII